MAWADVKAKLVFTGAGLSATDRTDIEAAMKTAYDGSATAKKMFDDWVNAGKSIEFIYKAGSLEAAATNNGKVWLDPDWFDTSAYVSKEGKGVTDGYLTGLIHELGHAILDLNDDWDAAAYKNDYLGANQTFINKILKELKLPEQASYTGYDETGKIIERGVDYTKGVDIDVVYYLGDGKDRSGSDDTNDLFFGDAGSETFKGGKGSDFFMGNADNDTYDGGAGTDTAIYKGSKLDYDVRYDKSSGEWTVKHVRGTKTDGTDTLKNVEKIRFLDGDETFNLTKNGLTYQTDFAFVVDTTGSMGDDIGQVKTQINTLLDTAFGGGTVDARVGLVSYKDTTIGEPTTVPLSFTEQDVFADRKTAAAAAVNGLSVSGGGDLPETAFSGLKAALDGTMGDWRYGAKILRIALFTDATAKDFDLLPTVLSLATSIGTTISVSTSRAVTGGRIDTFALGSVEEEDAATVEIYTISTTGISLPNLEEISKDTGGALLDSSGEDSITDILSDLVDTTIDFEGTEEDDEIDANANDNTIDAKGGDDTIRPKTGDDDITTGDGADVVKGSLAELDGDTIQDMSTDDFLQIVGVEIPRDQITVTTGSAILGFDSDNDGTADATVTLEGDFSGGDFMSVFDGADTWVSFETFLPDLADKTRVANEAINGVNNVKFLEGSASNFFKVTLQDVGIAEMNNTLGYYEIDALGNITDVTILFANANADKTASANIGTIDAGNKLAFFLVQDGADWAGALADTDALAFLDGDGTAGNIEDGSDLVLHVNGSDAVDALVFHAYDPSMNPKGIQRVLSGVDTGGESIQIGFEDTTNGGDRDYEDVLFKVEHIDSLFA